MSFLVISFCLLEIKIKAILKSCYFQSVERSLNFFLSPEMKLNKMDIDSDEDDRDIFSEVRGSRPCSTKIFQLLRTAVVALRCSICPAIKWSWVRFLPNVGLFFPSSLHNVPMQLVFLQMEELLCSFGFQQVFF